MATGVGCAFVALITGSFRRGRAQGSARAGRRWLSGGDGGLGATDAGSHFTRTRCEYTVTDLTDRTVPAVAGEHDPGLGPHLGTRVGHRDRPADDRHGREVVDVGAAVRDPRGVEAPRRDAGAPRGGLG